MSLSRWKMMAGVLGVSLGGLAAAGQCPKTESKRIASRQAEPPSLEVPMLPALPSAGGVTKVPPPPSAPAPMLPTPAIPAAPVIPRVPTPPELPDLPPPGKPTVPQAKPPESPPAPVIPASSTETKPALPAPMTNPPELPRPSATPPMTSPDRGPNLPQFPSASAPSLPSTPAPDRTPNLPPPSPSSPSGPGLPTADPLVESSPPAVRPSPVATQQARPQNKYRILLRVGEGDPTFEVKSGDDLILKVICEKIDIKSPEKGSGPSAVKASGKVRFVGFGAEGTCEELAFLAGTGEVSLSGAVKIQVKDKLGRVESELSTETMKYRIDPSAALTGGRP